MGFFVSDYKVAYTRLLEYGPYMAVPYMKFSPLDWERGCRMLLSW